MIVTKFTIEIAHEYSSAAMSEIRDQISSLPGVSAVRVAEFQGDAISKIYRPRERFNDDDWYCYNKATMELLWQDHPASIHSPLPGTAICRGMVAKNLGLWSRS